MDLILAFVLFLSVMAGCLLADVSMLFPLAAGFVIFSALSVRRGFTVKQILKFAAESVNESFIVIRILVLIGCLTGIWRCCGTVAYFVTGGLSLIPQGLFLPAAFLLAALMSYAIGSSFGVTATAGVILISIARAGNVNPVIAAGAILSGVYVGDRGSPSSSAANLVSVLTHTDMRHNIKDMFRCSIIPFAACCAAYGILSVFWPMQNAGSEIPDLLAEEFRLQWLCLVPAVIVMILPLCGMKVKYAMMLSLLASCAVALGVQHCSVAQCLKAILSGYEAKNEALAEMVSGGGITSMLEVVGILFISCCYGPVFRHTGLLSPVTDGITRLARRIGRYPAMLVLGVGVAAVFCNQTVGVIMQNTLCAPLYGDSPEECRQKMLDMENSVILLAGLVPWCIACAVPLGMLGADLRTLPFEFYLWTVPLWQLIRLRAGSRRKAAAA